MNRIYTLAHPLTKEVRYVGRTKLPLNKRLCCHVDQGRNRLPNNPRIAWVASLLAEGLRPEIEEVYLVSDGEDVIYWESYWIEQMLAWGHKLVNSTAPDEAGVTRPNTGKAVYQYTLDGQYIRSFCSAAEVQRTLGICRQYINQACRGRLKTAKGFRWSALKLETLPYDRPLKSKMRPVFQYNGDGQLIAGYESITDAAKATGAEVGNIISAALGKNRTSGGFAWSYKEQEQFIPRPVQSNAVAVLQLTLNGALIQEYPSCLRASEATGIAHSAINSVANGKAKQAGGFQWRKK